MGKLNYTKRKIEGLKLAQVVAKDLIVTSLQLKRIPPNIGSKAAFRDPVVELDVSGRALTSEGLCEVASALITSIDYEADENGRIVRLEELCLRESQLNTQSLLYLAQIISMVAEDLRDLDLSENFITITTDEHVAAWEVFLSSFSKCCVLRRIDLSGNALGPRAFEVLARVYAKESPVDLALTTGMDESLQTHSKDLRSANHCTEELEKRARKTSIALTKERDSSHMEAGPPTSVHREDGGQLEYRTPEKSSSVANHVETLPFCSTTRGLRSVPYLIFSDTAMTELCALHLSYLVICHNMPERLMACVPPPKAGLPAQQLAAYDSETRCRGVVYLPNPQLGTAGLKVLDLSEAVREGLLGEDDQETNSEAAAPSSKLASSTRRVSDTRSSAATGRRRSTASAGSTDHGRYGHKNGIACELDRARSRIQGNVLQESGPQICDLWWVALKMLTLGRNIHPAVNTAQPGAEMRFPQDFSPSSRSSKPGTSTALTPKNPNQNISAAFGQWRLDNSQLVPVTMTKLPPATKLSPPESPLATTTPTPSACYHSRLPCGFSEEVWRQIIAAASGAEGIMSEAQQRSVLRWAMDKGTLGRESGSLGLKESAQIWKVLEGTGCLAYEMNR